MKLLQALTTHFMNLGVVPAEALESFAEDMELQFVGQQNETGFLLCHCKYTAQFFMDRYNQHPGFLMAALMSWLTENDPYRSDANLPDPRAVIDINDDDSSDVIFSIEFIEPVYLIRDVEGLIQFQGDSWAFGDFVLPVADAVTVSA